MSLADSTDYNYDPDRIVTCRHKSCKWSGKMSECKYERILSSPQEWRMLAGRDGWHYNCPACGWLIEANYIRMS